MKRLIGPRVLRRWRFIAAAMVGIVFLVGGGALLAEPSDPATVMAFHGVPTRRVLDTREGAATPLGIGGTLDVVVSALPDDVTGVAINVTVVDGTEASFLTVFPTGDDRPNTSTINWSTAAAVANSATVNVHSDHSVTLYNLKGTVHVVLDLIGYYAPAPVGGATGPAGPFGQQGPAGADGTNGATGTDGTKGEPGAKGDDGTQGEDGVKGDTGAKGDTGSKGDVGELGAQGAAGTNAGPAGSVYLFAFNRTTETIATGSPVAFSTISAWGPAGQTGIVYDAQASTFVVSAAGVYKVTFAVSADQDSQLSIQINGTPLTGETLVFGAITNQTNLGGAVFTLAAGDQVRLANLSSAGTGTLHLRPGIGGSASAINAWIEIEQLNG